MSATEKNGNPSGSNRLVKTAVCDPSAFYPLRDLVKGPLETLDHLATVERFVRTVVLHDEIVMELPPHAYDPEVDFEFSEEETRAGGRLVITAFGPVTTGFDFFKEHKRLTPAQDFQLTPALLEVAKKFSNAGPGNVYYESHIDFLQRVLALVKSGGSALLLSEFGCLALNAAETYPAALFEHLDADWRLYAKSAESSRFGFLVPPVFGIVLTRCTSREMIPTVICELRAEWADARRKVWECLDALRECRTLSTALKIEQELSEASRFFCPGDVAQASRPIRILWDFVAAVAAGAGIATLSGGKPAVGALTGGIAQAARTAPGFVHEFGHTIFGRGAFDLANKVRRETRQLEFGALSRILTSEEKQKLAIS